MKSSHELSLELDELEKEKQAAINSKADVLIERHRYSRAMAVLELKRKDLDRPLIKSRQNLELKISELNVVRNRYFAAIKENR